MDAAGCELLPWDSEHFGMAIGRVRGGALNPESARAAVAWARANDVRCLYLLADASDRQTVRSAEACGFRLADVRLTLGRSAARAGTGDSALQAVRPAEACDLAALEPVAAGVHTDSRFFFDERFDRAAAADLYRRWLRASLAGELADLAYVAEAGGEPAGYITGRTDPATATVAIGLLGLAERARGKGLGTRLVAALLAGASGAGAARITVVTQGRNVQAQRLYQRAGFRTERVELWYHWWSGPGRPAAPGG